MIVDGGTINCSGKCNKINLTMGGAVERLLEKGDPTRQIIHEWQLQF
jgi:hypothetical protein